MQPGHARGLPWHEVQATVGELSARRSPDDVRSRSARAPIAPLWHTIVFLLLIVVLSAGGYFGTRGFASGGASSTHQRFTIYLFTLAEEWILFFYVYFGVRSRGVTARSLIAARWATWSGVRRDVALAFGTLIGFVAIEALGALVFHGAHSRADRTLAQLTPYTPLELVVWIAISISAGICEEFVFRGYVQEQFRRLTGSVTAGVVIQSLFFGGAHGYQGWPLMVTIAVAGIFFGVIAAWRKSLAPTMIAHGLADTVGGLAGFIQHIAH